MTELVMGSTVRSDAERCWPTAEWIMEDGPFPRLLHALYRNRGHLRSRGLPVDYRGIVGLAVSQTLASHIGLDDDSSRTGIRFKPATSVGSRKA